MDDEHYDSDTDDYYDDDSDTTIGNPVRSRFRHLHVFHGLSNPWLNFRLC